MAPQADTLEVYPPGGPARPRTARGTPAAASRGSRLGPQVFSADNHISLSEDIFYERCPRIDEGPRTSGRQHDDAWTMAAGDKPLLPREFAGVLMQYDPLPGSTTGELETRLDAARGRRGVEGTGLPERPVGA